MRNEELVHSHCPKRCSRSFFFFFFLAFPALIPDHAEPFALVSNPRSRPRALAYSAPMPRTTLFSQPAAALGWMRRAADRTSDAAPIPPPVAAVGADPLAFMEECGIHTQIAERRQRVLAHLASLLRRHVAADAAHRRDLHEQVRSLARWRSEIHAARNRLDAPHTFPLPASAELLMASLHAETEACTSFDAGAVEQQRLNLTVRAASAASIAVGHVNALEHRVEQLAVDARASLAALWKESSRLLKTSMRTTDQAVHGLADVQLPPVYGQSDNRRDVLIKLRISTCLSHLALAAEMLGPFVHLQVHEARLLASPPVASARREPAGSRAAPSTAVERQTSPRRPLALPPVASARREPAGSRAAPSTAVERQTSPRRPLASPLVASARREPAGGRAAPSAAVEWQTSPRRPVHTLPSNDGNAAGHTAGTDSKSHTTTEGLPPHHRRKTEFRGEADGVRNRQTEFQEEADGVLVPYLQEGARAAPAAGRKRRHAVLHSPHQQAQPPRRNLEAQVDADARAARRDVRPPSPPPFSASAPPPARNVFDLVDTQDHYHWPWGGLMT